MTIDRARVTRRGFLGLGAAAGIITLTACGSDSDGDSGSSSGGGKLVMTVWGGEPDKTAYQKRIDLLVKKYPDISITLQLIPSETYEQKVQTMIAGGSGPDIMQVAENVNVYSSKNQLSPLDDLAKGAGIDLEQRFGPIGSLYSYKDKVYAVPDRSGAMITYYNKTMFSAANLEAPTAEWTWEQTLAAFKALTIPGKQWGYAGAEWWAAWWGFVYQNGGKIIDDSGKPVANSDQVVEALQWAGDLVNKHGVVPTKKQYADFGADVNGDAAFAQGKIAVSTTGFWAISGLLKSNIDWGIAPFWRGKQQAVTAFGSGLAISRTSKNPNAAIKAIEFLSAPDAQKVIIETGQDVPANIEVQKSDAFLKPTWMTKPVDMDVFGESSAFVYRAPFIPEWNEMQKAFENGLANFWLGKEDARTALNAVQKRLETIVKPAG
ncbi:ABC transporter substrate-binding protein [Phytohabitans aurantiacus]|jgi:multiple sugar transport system substrate-binding protein|uniref:Sugar ABC transporter substrate-binding protein n=1 Tax=Phytohabitans aurantiacus TaxID=3016789 RepID=A0ABQ5R1U3_9ACTN|nr:sugar ABC transporter substrate-binding protein [Phytohabitans aurantiacus]GLI00157.1 sugar ABC transporter substrate-binding protein [Phytohabitans aurantiacus]